MAGFLDRNTRIVDMVLTNNGKRLLSKGALHFCYWSPFDDEIEYSPIIAESASLTPVQLSSSIYQSIETTPIREATTGYRNFNGLGEDTTNVIRPLFTMAQGQRILPRTLFPDNSARTIKTKQRKVQRVYIQNGKREKFLNPIEPVDLGMERYASTAVTLDFSYSKDSFPTDFQPDGFHMKILRSGSQGWTEINPKRDMSNDLSYHNDIRIFTGRKGR